MNELSTTPSTGIKSRKYLYKSSCAVSGCGRKGGKKDGLSFHRFPNAGFVVLRNIFDVPEKVDKRKAWIKATGILLVQTYTKVCSLHFEKEDFILPDSPTKRPRLKQTAVPSRNLPGRKPVSVQSIEHGNIEINIEPTEFIETIHDEINIKKETIKAEDFHDNYLTDSIKIEPNDFIDTIKNEITIKEESIKTESIENDSTTFSDYEEKQPSRSLFSCKICDKTYTQLASLKKHNLMHGPFVCKICDKTFANRKYLRSHERTHTNERPYVCEICNNTFTHKRTLANHIRTHTGERPFACDICDQTFTQQYSLQKHKRMHTVGRTPTCEICNKTFTQQRALIRHQRKHNGEKPFACDFCDKTFLERAFLRRHQRSHTGEKPYACSLCDQKCSQKYNLRLHEQNHHGILIKTL